MPASDSTQQPIPQGESGANGGDPATLAPVPPPTDARLQFNQLNIQQIPQTALDRLPPENLVALLESTLHQSDKMDERRFTYFMDQAEKEIRSQRLNTIAGIAIAIAGFAVIVALTYMGNDSAAGIVAALLATIISVVVGSKLSR